MDVVWTGDTGSGTKTIRSYERAHEVSAGGKPVILGSADPAFRGDPARYNPEELLVAALSQCHMLWFLSLAALAGVVVTGYRDRATGTMVEDADGGGRFTEVVLNPEIEVESGAEKIAHLHEEAHHKCFIANSVNFPVTVTSAPVRMLPEPDVDEIALHAVLFALSDPSRLTIVAALSDGLERPSGELAGDTPKSTHSHHLRTLREAGVTHTRQEGTRCLISLRADALGQRFPGLLESVLRAAGI